MYRMLSAPRARTTEARGKKPEARGMMTEDNYKKPRIRTYRDLFCYTKGFELAMEVFRMTARFPKEERYSLVDQMRRSSRSIPVNGL